MWLAYNGEGLEHISENRKVLELVEPDRNIGLIDKEASQEEEGNDDDGSQGDSHRFVRNKRRKEQRKGRSGIVADYGDHIGHCNVLGIVIEANEEVVNGHENAGHQQVDRQLGHKLTEEVRHDSIHRVALLANENGPFGWEK